MPRVSKNDNFIDQTFTLLANLLLTLLPTSYREKQAFTYYRDGVFCGVSGDRDHLKLMLRGGCGRTHCCLPPTGCSK